MLEERAQGLQPFISLPRFSPVLNARLPVGERSFLMFLKWHELLVRRKDANSEGPKIIRRRTNLIDDHLRGSIAQCSCEGRASIGFIWLQAQRARKIAQNHLLTLCMQKHVVQLHVPMNQTGSRPAPV